MIATPSKTPLPSPVAATPLPLPTPTPERSCPSHDGPAVYLDEVPAFALRQGPGCEYAAAIPVIRKDGAFFDVLGKQGDWLLVDLCDGPQGWVFRPAIADMNSSIDPPDLATVPVTQEIPVQTLEPKADRASMEHAKGTLIRFYDDLYHKRYDEASKIFAGGYGIVIMWNVIEDTRDYPFPLRTACELNDFDCTLRVVRVAREEQISPMEYHFTVEFIRKDGKLYQYQQPYMDNPAVSQFERRVVKDCNGAYLVVNWPFYGY
jgi:hypothetical protein